MESKRRLALLTSPQSQIHRLTESRTVVLLFILHLLYDFKPEQRAKSQAGLLVMPLPAHKHLWNAAREEDWRREYEEMLRASKHVGYLSYGDLLWLGNDSGIGVDMDTARRQGIDVWMVSGDSFGILVMMAASSL